MRGMMMLLASAAATMTLGASGSPAASNGRREAPPARPAPTRPTFDLLIRGGTLVLPWGEERADAGVRDGRIAALGVGADASADEVLDAAGLHVLPGLIDPHVHLRDPGDPAVETIPDGTRAATNHQHRGARASPYRLGQIPRPHQDPRRRGKANRDNGEGRFVHAPTLPGGAPLIQPRHREWNNVRRSRVWFVPPPTTRRSP